MKMRLTFFATLALSLVFSAAVFGQAKPSEQQDDKARQTKPKPTSQSDQKQGGKKKPVKLATVVGVIEKINAKEGTIAVKPRVGQVQTQQSNKGNGAAVVVSVKSQTDVLLPGESPKKGGKKPTPRQAGKKKPAPDQAQGKGQPPADQKKQGGTKKPQTPQQTQGGKKSQPKPDQALGGKKKPQPKPEQARGGKKKPQPKPKQSAPKQSQINKLHIGQFVQVAYRTLEGKNFAVRVRVLRVAQSRAAE